MPGYIVILGFPGGSDNKESASNGKEPWVQPLGSERSPGEGNGFDFHFPVTNDVEHHVLVVHMYTLLGEMSFQSFTHIKS